MGAAAINRLGPQLLCGIIFVIYSAASILWSSGDQLPATLWLVSFTIAFAIGYWTRFVDRIWLGVIILVIIVTLYNQSSELNINPNYLGISLAVALAGAIAYNHRWAAPILLLEIWVTQSRTALMGAGIACLIGLWKWSRFVAMALSLLALLFILHQKSDGVLSLWSRLGIWQDTVNHFTIFGHGFGSFFTEYTTWPIRRNMTLQLAPHVYNDFLEFIFELGIGSIALWMLILSAWENHNPRDKLICLTFFAMTLSHFPLHIPLVAHLFAMTLGHLSNQCYERKYHDRMSAMAT